MALLEPPLDVVVGMGLKTIPTANLWSAGLKSEIKQRTMGGSQHRSRLVLPQTRQFGLSFANSDQICHLD